MTTYATPTSRPWNRRMSVRTITASATLTSDDDLVLVDASSGAVTVSLPPSSASRGKPFCVRKIDSTSNQVTIDPNGSEVFLDEEWGSDNTRKLTLRGQLLEFVAAEAGNGWHPLTLRQVWDGTLGNFGNAGATTLTFPMGGALNTTSAGLVAPYDCVLKEVDVRALHVDATSPPGTWTLDIHKNEATTATTSETFSFNAAIVVVQRTLITLASPVSLAKGDGIGFYAQGAAIDFPGCMLTFRAPAV